MTALVAEVALNVLLEVVTVEDDGLRGFRLRGVAGVAVVRVIDDQSEPSCVGRPFVRADAALDLGESRCFAAATIEKPHLTTLASVARGQEGQVSAVRAPARLTFAVLRGRDAQV